MASQLHSRTRRCRRCRCPCRRWALGPALLLAPGLAPWVALVLGRAVLRGLVSVSVPPGRGPFLGPEEAQERRDMEAGLGVGALTDTDTARLL